MFDDLIELALAEDPMLDELEREDVAELYVRAVEMRDIAANAVRKLGEHIGARFDTPVTLANGWVLQPSVDVRRTGWRKSDLIDHVKDTLSVILVNREGEPISVLPDAVVRDLFEPATGRTKNWRARGINPDAWCDVTKVPSVKVVK